MLDNRHHSGTRGHNSFRGVGALHFYDLKLFFSILHHSFREAQLCVVMSTFMLHIILEPEIAKFEHHVLLIYVFDLNTGEGKA